MPNCPTGCIFLSMRNVAVIFGGRSAEHDVSIITAHIPVIETLLAGRKYDVVPIYISRAGVWYSDSAMNNLEYFKEDFEPKLRRLKPLQLSFEKGLEIIEPGIFGKKKKIDIVFPTMHGTYGEDGSLPGLLRMANVPFVGCDLSASAVAMDKAFTKQILSAEGILVVPFVWFTKSEWEADNKRILEQIARLKSPRFVKPVHLGSSIAITKVKSEAELVNAIEVALHYDDKALVEESVEDLIEVTLPIIGNNEPRAAEVEHALNKTEVFDFNEKYLSGGKKSVGGVNRAYSEIPANIGEEVTSKVKEMGKQVYRILGCTGIARVDFLIDGKTKKIFVNEVNTLPGSLYHHNWRKAGVSNMELIEELIRLAEERFASQKNTTFTFKSDILKKVGGPKIGA
ncbi:MAG: D-alanine-D-alanine ligase [Parcubacteria group bacterium GW2011_GWA2_51_10]|nr:MAG: D-alanine-D-alanine ligase [Parcubacteria group bacterium GW2011_GWA2_51_10]